MTKVLFLVDDKRRFPFWKREGFPDVGTLKDLWQNRSEAPCGDPIYLTPQPGFVGDINDYFTEGIKTAISADKTFSVVTDEDFDSDSPTSGGVALLNALC